MEEDEFPTTNLSRALSPSVAEAVRQSQASFADLARLATPRIAEVQSALAALSVPAHRMTALTDALAAAALPSSFASISQVVAQQQIDLQSALGSLRIPQLPDLSHITVPPSFDLSQIAGISTSLSQQFAESLRLIDSETLSTALRRQFEPTLERVAEIETESEDPTAKVIDFLWAWTLMAFHEAGAALESLDPNMVLTVVLALILHFHALESSSADFEALSDRIETLHQTTPAETDERDTPEQLVATERLNLRAEPSESAHVIVTMNPNQTLELIRVEGDWCYVRYQDHIAELPRHGWASRAFLKPIAL